MTRMILRLKVVSLLVFLMTGLACSYKPLTITGTVVDESGASLSDVTVQACYSGWGWNDEDGYLVWDKNYCSETTQTDSEGVYSITFRGPVSSRLKAKKEGWVQTEDFNTTHSRIILTRSEVHSSRLRAESEKREQERRLRRADESGTDYYCRVVLPVTRSVNLRYKDESLSVTPALLRETGTGNALFAVSGSSPTVNQFCNEIVLRINGKAAECTFVIMPDEANCGGDEHFISVYVPGQNQWPDTGIEILVHGIKALFDMRVWHPEIQR